MYCTLCGTPHTEEASFCANCGSPLTSVQAPASPQSGAAPPQRTIAHGDLASFGQRIGSALIDFVLGSIPFVDVPVLIANGIMHGRGDSIGLKIAGARIVRRNGDVSGFFHTAVRVWAAILSASAKNGGTIRLGRYDWYVASNGQVRSDPTWEAAKAYP